MPNGAAIGSRPIGAMATPCAVASRRRAHGDLHSHAPTMKRCGSRACARRCGRPEHAGQASLESVPAPTRRRYPGRAGGRARIAAGSPISVSLSPRSTCAAGIPRHDRRNRTPRRAPHRPTPAAHARVALGARRRRAAGAARRLVCHGGRSRRRGRRHPSLHASARADGVSRPRPFGVLERAQRPTRRDHQSGQSARAAIARGSGVGVSRVPRIGRQMLYRQEALPKTVCDIAWKAQLRLTSRFRKLVARGKAKPKVATAIARELTGFIWAIAREVPAPPA